MAATPGHNIVNSNAHAQEEEDDLARSYSESTIVNLNFAFFSR